MPASPIGNEEEWRALAADPETRALLRRVATTVLSEIDPEKVKLYRLTAEAKKAGLERQRRRAAEIDTEVSAIDELIGRLPEEGEAGAFKGMMEERRTALLMEAQEVMEAAEKAPGEIEKAERIIREVEGQVANAEFLMRVIEEVEDAEGGVHRVADEPRGADHTEPAGPDGVRDV